MKKIILFISLLIVTLFISTSELLAKEVENNIQHDIYIETKEIKPDENKKTDIPDLSIEELLGDEQTFPFVAGLGKNSAH